MELKPCPFCGSEARRCGVNSQWVTCNDLSCRCSKCAFTDVEWNVRREAGITRIETDTLLYETSVRDTHHV